MSHGPYARLTRLLLGFKKCNSLSQLRYIPFVLSAPLVDQPRRAEHARERLGVDLDARDGRPVRPARQDASENDASFGRRRQRR